MEFSKSDLHLTSGASTPAAFGNVAPTVLYILSFGRIGPAAAKSKKKMVFENMFFPLGRLFNAKFTVHLHVALFHSLLLFWQPWAVGWAHPTNQWAGGWHSTIFKTLPSFYDVQSCFGSIFFVHMIHIYIYLFSTIYIYIHKYITYINTHWKYMKISHLKHLRALTYWCFGEKKQVVSLPSAPASSWCAPDLAAGLPQY